MTCAEPEISADGEIDQPVILAETLVASCRPGEGAAAGTCSCETKGERRAFFRRAVSELADDMHRRKGLPVEAYGSFRSPSWLDVAGAEVVRVVATIESAAFNPPGPAVFGDWRDRWRRLGEIRLVEIGGTGAWRGGECYYGDAREESDPEAMILAVHFVHPCGESCTKSSGHGAST